MVRKCTKQDNVQLNTESVQCISIAYSEVRITEITEPLGRVDQSGYNENDYFQIINNVQVIIIIIEDANFLT